MAGMHAGAALSDGSPAPMMDDLGV